MKTFEVSDNYNDHILAVVHVALYVFLALLWGLMSDGTWDDDCVERYYNTSEAFDNPFQFIELWNRPLFIMLFCVPVLIAGKYSVLVLMVTFSAAAAFFLYRSLRMLEVKNAFLVIPFFLFQQFYFGVSRNALTEPLAASIIALGLYAFLKKNWISFALIGSLLPLARLELAVLLGIWAYLLFREKKWQFIPLLGAGLILWDIAGGVITGDWLYLYNQTFGKEGDNLYGHLGFWHYFERYIHVTGPVVFCFAFIGLFERIISKKADLFIEAQFAAGFMMYVILSWKLSMGNAGGFLRNITPVAPLAAVIALHGFNFLLQCAGSRKALKSAAMPASVQTAYSAKRLTRRQRKQLQGNGRSDHAKKSVHSEEEENKTHKAMIYRYVICCLLLLAVIYFFLSYGLLYHHELSPEADYTNMTIAIMVFAFSMLTILLFKTINATKMTVIAVCLILSVGVTAFTLVTETPGLHMSEERKVISKISDIYAQSHLRNFKTFNNHPWFYWANDLDRDDPQFNVYRPDSLLAAPVSTVVIWESHYTTGERYGLNVQLSFFQQHPEFVELCRITSANNNFIASLYQKVENSAAAMDAHNEFLKYFPALPEALVSRGNSYMNRTGDYASAINDFNNALSTMPKLYDAYFGRGLAHFNQQNWRDGATDFLTAAQYSSSPYQDLFNAGSAYANAGDPSSAVKCFSNAIQMKPDYIAAYQNRSQAYSKLNEFDKALADYTKILELDSKNVQAYYNRGELYVQTGKMESACSDFQLAAGMGHEGAKDKLTYLCLQNEKKI